MADELSPIKRALLEQRRLKARIEELEHARREPVAVVGLGCRFPGGANGPAAFWELLGNGVDAISDMPADRWDVAGGYDADPEAPGKFATRFGGFLDGIDQFDPHAFGISPREAETMDPQQRVLLEVAWEALGHAGWAPDRLTGSMTGVFVGIGTNDYFNLYGKQGARTDIDAYLATGSAHSVASGRLSYLLGLQGPSISVDTACSASLVAVHLACESIRSGSCDAALAGGVGILLSEENYVSLSKARMMAPDGRCKTFDASADGFVRSEGCGIVVLKRLRDARRDGDRVLAVIRGTACNQDGRSNGITAPNGPAQQAVIRAALANAGVAPASVSYVETHGTGTVLGDPIEVESLTAVLGNGRGAGQELLIGSVKTNLGHLEAAAGVAGLIKTVLALQHRAIPPSLHFRTPNPHIEWNAYPYLRVPTTMTRWDVGRGPRTAGVSAFGFSGTNVHLVVEEAPVVELPAPTGERPVHLLAISGTTDAALRIAARELAAHLSTSRDAVADVCFSVNTGRATLGHRAVVRASAPAELGARLQRLASGLRDADVRTGVVAAGVAPRVVWYYPDAELDARQVSELYATQSTFRAAMDACGPAGFRTERFAVQYALTALWKRWGLTSDAVIGDVSGHYAAAVAAGLLSLEEALRLVASRDAAGPGLTTAPHVPFYSSVSGSRVAVADASSIATWARGGSPERRDAAVAAAVADGCTVLLEIGAAPAAPAARPRPAGLDLWTPAIGRDGRNWDAIAEAAAELFVRGVAIDWRGFDGDYMRARVDVPAAPWMRERYWFSAKPAGSVAEPSSAFTTAAGAADRQAGFMPLDVELPRYAELWRELDAFTTRAIARTLSGFGLFRSAGDVETVDSARSRAGVLPVYRHLLSLWLQRLTRAGVLERRGDSYVATTRGLYSAGCGSLGPESDRTPTLRDYLQRCDRHLADIVTGHQGPLETLFPEGSFDTADFFYREWGLARYYNGIMGAAAASLLRRAAGRPLRVLEVGAGTGGSTASLLPILAAGVAEYWFTDVSEHFFGRAERAFASYPFVRCQRFDLDADPVAQGIPTGHFDLVVAANAVHATKDLVKAIEHARSLLAPGGLLMLYEVTTHFDWFEMSIALIEGWQHHADDVRGETPLLTPSKWREVLGARGFDHVSCFPPAESPAGVLGHHVIVASASATTIPVAAVAPPLSIAAPFAPGAGPAAPPSAPVSAATSAAHVNGSNPAIRERLAALTSEERTDAVQEIVQRQVIRVMRLRPGAPPPAAEDRLMSIGMDSLMAVELKKLLTKELDGTVNVPSTLIFDYPTIAAIASFALKGLGFGHGTAELAAAARGRPSAAMAIASLSEEEVETLLAEQLKGFNG